MTLPPDSLAPLASPTADDGSRRVTARTARRRGSGHGLPASLQTLRHLFLIFAILVAFGVNVLPNTGGANDLDVDPLAPIFHAIVLAGTVALSLPAIVRVGQGLARAVPFLLILGYCAASAGWSFEPLTVLRAAGSMGQVMLLAAVATTTLGTTAICRIQVQAMVIAAIASIVVAALFPASGYDIALNAGAMRGIFTQKNQLGEVMVAGLIALSYLVLREGRVTRGSAAVTVLAMATILLARSVTSLMLGTLVIAATLAALMWVRRSRWALPMLAGTGTLLAMTVIAACLFPQAILDVFGKDLTLTGRSGIWRIIYATTGGTTLLGAGYSAFWSPASLDAQLIWQRIGFVTQSAHSGYLQTLLELGAVGLALFGLALAATLGRIAGALSAGARVGPAWLLIVIGFVLLFNVDEVSWPRPDIHLFQWMLAYLGCRRNAASLNRWTVPPARPADGEVLDLPLAWLADAVPARDRTTVRSAGPDSAGEVLDLPLAWRTEAPVPKGQVTIRSVRRIGDDDVLDLPLAWRTGGRDGR